MPGRRPTPSALKKLRGTDQPCRMNDNEPEPEKVMDMVSVDPPEYWGHTCDPDCLEDCTKNDIVAFKTWEWLVPRLIQLKVLTELDLETVTKYCEIVSDLREIRGMLKEYGRLSYVEKVGEDGNKYYEAKSSPAAVQYNNLLSQFRAFSGMLGLDPASRPKIYVPGPEGDKAADIFG